MDLFELLLIAVFVLFPILDQLFKRGRKGGQLPESKLPGEEGRVDPAPDEREPVSAADMVPDDLWAVLTGERRERGGVATRPEPRTGPAEPVPWSIDAEEMREEPIGEPAPSWWNEEPEEQQPGLEPVSLEYEGPEAYSLERVDFRPESLEKPIPEPEARHRAFHEIIDRPGRRRRREPSALVRALRRPEGIRQAVVLKEVLGPPKGLE